MSLLKEITPIETSIDIPFECHVIQPECHVIQPECQLLKPECQIVQPGSEIDAQFDSLQQSLTKFKANVSDMQQQLRTLEKIIKKDSKKRDTVKPTTLRQPKLAGFDILEDIPTDVSTFMQKPNETKLTRNTVTNYIIDYIRHNKLQDMVDRKRIHLNSELAALFKVDINEPVTYFNLHKYISSLFNR